MSTLAAFFSEPWAQRLGWTLIHFLWQGAGIAIFLALALQLLVNASSHLRYLAIAGAFVLCAAMPLGTWLIIGPENKGLVYSQNYYPSQIVPNEAEFSGFKSEVASVDPVSITPSQKMSWLEDLKIKASAFLPYLVALWFFGVLFLFVRLVCGWAMLQRLCASGQPIDNSEILERLASLMEKMGITFPIQILQTTRVEVPTLIGWLRPKILMPFSVLSGLSTEQLEAILAHELAHVLRHDYLVNLLQTTMETFFFYHPAIWWLGRKLRDERENCCDDIALSVMQDKLVYASALALLEEKRSTLLVLNASGGQLLQRIRRITGTGRGKISLLPILITAVALGFVVVPILLQKSSVNVTKSKLMDQNSLDQALVKAVKKGNTAEVERLLSLGANPDSNSYLWSVLLIATEGNRSYIIKLLLKYHADPDGYSDKEHPIDRALDQGLYEVAKTLREGGAKISSEAWAGASNDLSGLKSMVESGVIKKGKTDEAMKYAVAMGHLDAVKFLEKIDDRAVAGKFLMQAAKSADVEMMKYVLSQGADIKTDGALALEQAVIYYNQAKSAEFLLTQGADPNRLYEVQNYGQKKSKRALLTCAKDASMVKVLLEAGADPNLQVGNYTPLIYAPDRQSVDLLLKKGANLKPPLERDLDLLRCVVIRDSINTTEMGDPGEVVDELIKRGADFNAQGNGLDLLVQAAMLRELKVCRALLDAGVSPDAYSSNMRRAALTEAAQDEGNPSVLELLLERRADVNKVRGVRGGPLGYALNSGSFVNADLLRNAGALDVGLLSEASARGDLKKVKELIRSGADVNEGDAAGFTPLLYAIRRGQSEIALFLLEKGANINQFTSLGNSPKESFDSFFEPGTSLDWNVDSGNTTSESRSRIAEFKKLFKKYVANPNYQDLKGRAAIHQAAFAGNTSVVEYLVKQKAEVNLRDAEGNTPLLLAALSPAAIQPVLNSNPEHGIPSIGNTQAYIVYKLLQAGAKLDLKMPDGETVGDIAIAAAKRARNAQLIAVLRSPVVGGASNNSKAAPPRANLPGFFPLEVTGEIPSPSIDEAREKEMSQAIDKLTLSGLKVDDMALPVFLTELTKLLKEDNPGLQKIFSYANIFPLVVPNGDEVYKVSLHLESVSGLREILNKLSAKYPIRYQVGSDAINVWQVSPVEIDFNKKAEATQIRINLEGASIAEALRTIQTESVIKGFVFDIAGIDKGDPKLKPSASISLKQEQISVADALRAVFKTGNFRLVSEGNRFFVVNTPLVPIEKYQGNLNQVNAADSAPKLEAKEYTFKVVPITDLWKNQGFTQQLVCLQLKDDYKVPAFFFLSDKIADYLKSLPGNTVAVTVETKDGNLREVNQVGDLELAKFLKVDIQKAWSGVATAHVSPGYSVGFTSETVDLPPSMWTPAYQ